MKWYGWPFGQAARGEMEAAVMHPMYRAGDGREVAGALDWDGEAWPTLAEARMRLVREMRLGDIAQVEIAEAGRITSRDVPVVYDYRED